MKITLKQANIIKNIIEADSVASARILFPAYTASAYVVGDTLPDPSLTPEDLDRQVVSSYAKLAALKNMTPAQIQTWATSNVTTFAQAQDAITTLAIAVAILARRI